MAFSSINFYRKGYKLPCKKNSASVKRYFSADKRIWSNDSIQKSMGLHDILTCIDLNSFNSDSSSEVAELLEQIKQKDHELEQIHMMYNSLAKNFKNMEEPNNDDKKYLVQSEDIKHKDKTNDQFESVKQRTEKYEEILKERDELKQELSKVAHLEDLLKNLKMRAEEADKMEQEIYKLKSDLQKCGHGASGDKLKIEPTRVSSDLQCNKCQEYVAELKQSSSMLEMRERKCSEIEAERNFLLQRAEMIRCMEAELILYKVRRILYL